jgi:hypothetical protein
MCWSAIESNYCKKLLPFSELPKRFLIWQNKERISNDILSKIEVFYGGVHLDEESLQQHKQFVDKGEGVICARKVRPVVRLTDVGMQEA